MEAASAGFNSLEVVFLICAICGGIVVAFRFVMMFIGGDVDTHGDMELDLDIDSATGDVDFSDISDISDVDISDVSDVSDVGEYHDAHIDADHSFRLLSLHGLSAFFMMFGLLGLALYRGSHLSDIESIGGAIAGGLGTVWIMGKIFGTFVKFQSSGTINIKNAIGCEGSVYLTIPRGGIGRVTADIRGRQMELDARSADGSEIPTGVAVRVVGVKGNMLRVKKL